jgi:pimeloyl-ACP methyl ester carboxylesterase
MTVSDDNGVERLRLCRAAGLATLSVLVFVSLAIAPDASSAKGVTVVEFSTHKTATLWQAALVGLAVVSFLWFAERRAGRVSSESVGRGEFWAARVGGRAVMVAVLATSVAACGANGGGSTRRIPPNPAAATTSPPGYEPRFDRAPCDAAVPASPRVECGVLSVPLDRADPGGAQVKLPVAVVRTEAATRDGDRAVRRGGHGPLETDPIVYLSGGPGFAGRDLAGYFLDHHVGGSRDVILFDQRGTGASTPSLDCPEVEPVAAAALTAADPSTVEGQRAQAALSSCRRRLLGQGVDLNQFDTTATALDVRDLRRALGIERWNLFGRSYGTTVALEVLRFDGEAVRAAVLDSVYPPDVPIDAGAVEEHADRAFAQLFTGCEQDPGCHQRYPSVEADFAALVQEWNADPYQTTVEGPAGRPVKVVITGDDVVAGVWGGMYDGAVTAAVPSLVQPLRERGAAAHGIVSELAGQALADLTRVAEGVAISVDCADRQRLDRHDESGVLTRHPEYGTLLSLGIGAQWCATWDVESVDSSFNEPVTSDVPTLVFGDRYDPRTPPADGERAAATLSRSTFVLTSGLGHAASLREWCLTSMLIDFVADPEAPVDTSCAASLTGPRWS